MKNRNVFTAMTLTLTVLSTSACRLDPAALLGSDPQIKEQRPSDSDATVCSQRAFEPVFEVDDKNCATPNEKELAIYEIARGTSDSEVRISLRKLSDGKFPKIVRLRYQDRSMSQVLYDLTCKEVTPPVNNVIQEHVCQVPADVIEKLNGYTRALLFSLQVKNEACEAITIYQAKALDDKCAQDGSVIVDRIYFRNTEAPQLYLRKYPKPEKS